MSAERERRERKGRRLYVGGDESNYSGRKREHEIAVYTAVFSYDGNDVRLVEIPPGRTNTQKKRISRWLEGGGRTLRDFRFALVHYDYFGKRRGITLVDVFPYLVRRFMRRREENIEKIAFHMDGDINDGEREKLERVMPGKEIEVYAHPKIIPTAGEVHHPRIVEAADILSHIAFRELSRSHESAVRVINSPKRVKLKPNGFPDNITATLRGNEARIEHFLRAHKNGAALYTFF